MGIEIYGFMMNKKAMSEVSLRVFLYIQLSLELSKNPQGGCYISRRAWAKSLALSENGIRKAVSDLTDLRMIRINAENINQVFITPKREWNTAEIRRRLMLKDEPDKAHPLEDGSSSGEET